MGQVRESKKQQTRQRISDVATELFFARGFEAVTVDEIALAAQVSKMTVFNYFSRKEDLILDRDDDLKLLPFRQALAARSSGQSPTDAILAVVREMHSRKEPLCHINALMVGWWRVVNASPALKARMRELADEAAEGLASELAGPKPDGLARMAAAMIVMTLRVAREEAVHQVEKGVSAKKANALFLELMAQGLTAVEALLSNASRTAAP